MKYIVKWNEIDIIVYKASNGNIFYKHDFFTKELTDLEIKKLHETAKNIYENKNCTEIEAREYAKPIPHISYYLNDEFICSDIHISSTFDPLTKFIYLKKATEKTVNEKLCEAATSYERKRNGGVV